MRLRRLFALVPFLALAVVPLADRAGGTPGSCPSNGAGHEYLATWSGSATTSAPDMVAVIDGEAGCDTYGKVAQTSTVPGADAKGNEPHAMQEIFRPGQTLVSGGLLSSRQFTWDLSLLPAVSLTHTTEAGTFAGGVWGDFAGLPDGSYYGTLMAKSPSGGTPGALAHISAAGTVLSVTSAASPEGIPACSGAGGCANPHGLAVRTDLHTALTSDYADPVPVLGGTVTPAAEPTTYRPTVRLWDIAAVDAPVVTRVDVLPAALRGPADPNHAENLGMLEVASTLDYPLANGTIPKGAFAMGACGGAIFYTSDISNTVAHPWHEVFDSLAAILSPQAATANPITPATDSCRGATGIRVTPDNRFVVASVNAHYNVPDVLPSDQATKLVYTLNIQNLVAAGSHYDCNITSARAISDPTKGGIDCPTVAGALPVLDSTQGGPTWLGMDNFTLGTSGSVQLPGGGVVPNTHALTRFAFTNYFVARSRLGGDNKVCAVNVDPSTGALQTDNTFIDENRGTPCVNFNRPTWPSSASPAPTGHYNPASVLFIENNAPLTGRTFNAAGATTGWWGAAIDNGTDSGGFPYSA